MNHADAMTMIQRAYICRLCHGTGCYQKGTVCHFCDGTGQTERDRYDVTTQWCRLCGYEGAIDAPHDCQAARPASPPTPATYGANIRHVVGHALLGLGAAAVVFGLVVVVVGGI